MKFFARFITLIAFAVILALNTCALTDGMKGIWIASLNNINFPSSADLSDEQLKKEIDAIASKTEEMGFDTIFFQVKPTSDALYSSDIFPVSEYLYSDGVLHFDVLEYLIQTCKVKNISVHAWMNPYRASFKVSEYDSMPETSLANIYREHTIVYGENIYFNPASKVSETLIVDSVKEILDRYPDLAGIHFDDYFYPYPISGKAFDDAKSYAEYTGELSLEDWRRENVNSLIRKVYNAVKEKGDYDFGVSPFGIWANASSDTYVKGSNTNGLQSYSDHYCDTLMWIKENTVDYIIPQIYWDFASSSASFGELASWWDKAVSGSGVKYYIGHAAYKSDVFKSGEIKSQIDYSRMLDNCSGNCFYGYENIAQNINGVSEEIKSAYKEKQYLDEFKIYETSPSGASFYDVGETVYVSCVAPAGAKVNAVIGGMKLTLLPQTSAQKEDGKFVKEIYSGSVKPSTFSTSEKSATLGSLKITITDGDKQYTKLVGLVAQNRIVPKKPSASDASENKVENKPAEEKPAETEKPEENQEAVEAFAPTTPWAEQVYAEVINDYSHLKISTTSSFYDDFTPASAGMRDIIAEEDGEFYKLRFGGYIRKENVRKVSRASLFENHILSVSTALNIGDTRNLLCNSTDVRFMVLDNVPVNLGFEEGRLSITFFNTFPSYISNIKISDNPVIKAVSVTVSVTNNTVTYHFSLKDADNYYGSNVIYENGMIILRINNPQSLDKSDKPLTGKTIAVDAGHGGRDPGACYHGKYESTLNLSIALKLAEKLTELGADVRMTRNTDTTVSLEERMEFFTKLNPDMVISIHHNAAENSPSTSGYLGLYCSDSGKSLAETLTKAVVGALGRYEVGTRYQQLAVCRNHRFPSTLCEMSYISNKNELQWTLVPENVDKSAQALADGVIEYYKKQEKYLEY